MSLYYYDLHVHSCLSPCGDDDMTPGNIVGMSCLNGLQIVALTDHNSTKNCPAFYKIAKANGIIPVAGVEVTTSEDVHVVCLFRTLERAMEFGKHFEKWDSKTDLPRLSRCKKGIGKLHQLVLCHSASVITDSEA